GLVYPRDTWWMRCGAMLGNLLLRLRRPVFHFYVHRSAAVEELLYSQGLERRYTKNVGFWQVSVYARGQARQAGYEYAGPGCFARVTPLPRLLGHDQKNSLHFANHYAMVDLIDAVEALEARMSEDDSPVREAITAIVAAQRSIAHSMFQTSIPDWIQLDLTMG